MQNVCGGLSLPVASYPGTHPGTQTISFPEPSGKRGNRSEPSGKRGRWSSPRERKQMKKIMAFSHCRGPHAHEATNLNAVLVTCRGHVLRVSRCQIQLSLSSCS